MFVIYKIWLYKYWIFHNQIKIQTKIRILNKIAIQANQKKNRLVFQIQKCNNCWSFIICNNYATSVKIAGYPIYWFIKESMHYFQKVISLNLINKKTLSIKKKHQKWQKSNNNHALTLIKISNLHNNGLIVDPKKLQY